MPDFVVLGAMRAGTTTLYHHLDRHPDIAMSRMKETDFFIEEINHSLGYDWYRRQFPLEGRVCGEISPNYTMNHIWQGVAERLGSASPEVRLAYIVRDPIERFVSQYLHTLHIGRTRAGPEEVLNTLVGRNMVQTSRYRAQLEVYLKHFPLERIQILDFDELCHSPQQCVDRFTGFLGLAPHPVSEVQTRNDSASMARLPAFVQVAWRSRIMRRFDGLISRRARNRARRWLSVSPKRPDPEIGPDFRARVAELLADDTAAFRALTGQAFADWSL